MRAANDPRPSGPPLLGPLLVAVRRPENRIVLVAAAVIVLGGACVFIAVFAARAV